MCVCVCVCVCVVCVCGVCGVYARAYVCTSAFRCGTDIMYLCVGVSVHIIFVCGEERGKLRVEEEGSHMGRLCCSHHQAYSHHRQHAKEQTFTKKKRTI